MKALCLYGRLTRFLHKNLTVKDTPTYENKYNKLVMCHTDSKNTIIAVVYRPKDSSTQKFGDLLLSMRSKHKNR